jgi:hypothetical protein
LKPASTARNARVASTAVSIDIAVPTRSISANPRTLAVATANRTSAVIAVTTFASTIVWKPREYPVWMAARMLRPPPPGGRFLFAVADEPPYPIALATTRRLH